jgi:regulator of replication initiation timing
MKAQQMLVLTNMLAKIMSEVDDLKAMIKEQVNENFKENFEGEEE